MMQFSIILIVISMQHLKMPYYQIVASLLLLWGIYAFMKDFLVFLRVEKAVAQIIVEGMELEKRNIKLGKLFCDALRDFNLMRTLSIRSFVNFAVSGCYGYFLRQFIHEIYPAFTISLSFTILMVAGFTALTCKLYYVRLRPLQEMKASLIIQNR